MMANMASGHTVVFIHLHNLTVYCGRIECVRVCRLLGQSLIHWSVGGGLARAWLASLGRSGAHAAVTLLLEMSFVFGNL